MAWIDRHVAYGGLGEAGPVLEVGSFNVNGSVRTLFPRCDVYVGVDVAAGPGVDQVIDSRQPLPFDDATFAVVVSTECLEHAEFPWFVISEMGRVARPGSLILVTARGWVVTNPDTGEVRTFGYHNPPDLWRFSGEAMRAMAEHAGLEVVEVVQDPQVPGWFLCARKP